MCYPKNMEKNKQLFDVSLLRDFREVINSSNVFSDVPEYKHFWNLICVLMDRLDSAVHYLNNHSEQPKTEEDFVVFLVFATILKDGIYKFHENIYGIKPKTIDKKKWFKGAHNYSKPLFNETNCPTDDIFFEYLRSLAYAHPFETSKRNGRVFMNEGEIHLSPWVIANSVLGLEKDSVGLRVYTNNDEGLTDVFVSFSNLKNYLLERFLLLKTFIKWGRDEIVKQNKKWMETKVDRIGSPIDILKNICSVLESRFLDHYLIDVAIDILSSEFKLKKNEVAVSFVKDKIVNVLESVCDCVDKLDYEGMEECLNFIYERPQKLHNNAYYELEKTFDYLGDERGTCPRGSNEEWGLIQAEHFYNSYAKQFVIIDFNTMTYKDIKILMRVSLIIGASKDK